MYKVVEHSATARPKLRIMGVIAMHSLAPVEAKARGLTRRLEVETRIHSGTRKLGDSETRRTQRHKKTQRI